MEKKFIAVLHLHLLMLHQVSFYELRYIFTYYDKWPLSTQVHSQQSRGEK